MPRGGGEDFEVQPKFYSSSRGRQSWWPLCRLKKIVSRRPQKSRRGGEKEEQHIPQRPPLHQGWCCMTMLQQTGILLIMKATDTLGHTTLADSLNAASYAI